MPEFVQSFVDGSPGFANVHEEVFPGRTDPVEAGFFGDGPEFVFVSGEGYPRGPGGGGPGRGEEFSIVKVYDGFRLVEIGRHA